MTRYLLGLIGTIGVLLSLVLPFEKHFANVFDPTQFGDYSSVFVSFSLLRYSPTLGLLIGAAAIAFGVFFYKEDEEKLNIATWVLSGLTTFTLLYSVREIGMRESSSFLSGSILNGFGFGWLTLLASTICCFVATRLEETEERIPTPKAVPMVTVKTTSMKKDSGNCTQCNQLNSTMATRCHACGATLPWVKPAKVQAPKASKAVAVKQASSSIDFGAAGGSIATFLFCAAVPFLGFFLWRYMEKEDSPYTGIALIAWIVGIVLHIGRFALKVA